MDASNRIARERAVAHLITEPNARRRPGQNAYARGVTDLIESTLGSPADPSASPPADPTPITHGGRVYAIRLAADGEVDT